MVFEAGLDQTKYGAGIDNKGYTQYYLRIYKTRTRMSRKKKQKAESGEDVKLVVRIEAELRDAFIEACQAADTTASREVRRFIREFLALSDKKA